MPESNEDASRCRLSSYGPIEYTRVNRSGGHTEYLIGVQSGKALLLSSCMNMPDNERLAAMGLPLTPLNLGLVACADRDIMFLQHEVSRGCGVPEPEVVRQLKAADYDLTETLLAPLDGWDDSNWTFLRGYARHGQATDTAAALLDALRHDMTCNAGLSDIVREWLRAAEHCWDTARKARQAALFGTRK